MSGRVSGGKKSRASGVPPPSPPTTTTLQRATDGGGGGGNRFSGIPAAVVGLIGSFADRPARIATGRASVKLSATIEAGCSIKSCLAAPKVRDSCVGVCEQRGARLISGAVADDPRVLREFTFLSADAGGSVRRVRFTSTPANDDGARKSRERGDPAPSRMQLEFGWDTDDTERWSDEKLRLGDRDASALYLADGKEARDILALIARTRTDHDARGYARADRARIVHDLQEIYERYRKPTTVGEITREVAETESTAVSDDDDEDEGVREEAAALRTDELLATYHEVTGRRLVGLPTAAPPIRFGVAWVTHTVASLFRDGSSGGWHLESANFESGNLRDTFTLQITASLADVGTLFLRLLSEPPVAFDRLALAPIDVKASRRTERAETALREGVRVWRGADLVSGKFAVEDAEFHRLYPEVRRLAAAAATRVTTEAADDRKEDEGEDDDESAEGKEEKRDGTSPPSPSRSTPTGARGRPETREERRAREATELGAERNVRRHYAPPVRR